MQTDVTQATQHAERALLNGVLGRFVVLDRPRREPEGPQVRAYDPVLRRELVLRIHSVHRDPPHRRDELVRAASALAKLSHPHLVAVYDAFLDERRLVVAQAAVSGQPLSEWLAILPHKPWPRVLRVFLEAGSGLAAAHAVGLVHGRFSEASIVVEDDGRALVDGFGLAPDATDAAHDQYGFCVALARALGDKRAVPHHVEAALERGLAPVPDERWPDMAALVAALTPRRRRRSHGLVAAVPIMALTSAWAWTAHTQRAARCTGARQELDGVWDQDRAARARAAVAATGVGYAATTWARLEQELDDYARGWAAHYQAACEATVISGVHSQRVMDLQMGCLQRRKTELRAVVDVLLRADARVVERAQTLLAGLPSLTRCADLEALQAEVPPPDDPDQADTAERARVLLAEADAHERAGQYDVARERLARARILVEQTDYAPVAAELGFARGSLLDHSGDYARADAHLEDAVTAALASGSLDFAAKALARMSFIAGYRFKDVPQAVRLAELAVALAMTRASEIQAVCNSTLGQALLMAGRFERAEVVLRRVLELRKRTRGEASASTAARNGLGTALWQQGRYEEALAIFRELIAAMEQTLGSDHPRLAPAQANLAMVLAQTGRPEQAEPVLRRAIAIRERIMGVEHPDLVAYHRHLARILETQGRHAEARAELAWGARVLAGAGRTRAARALQRRADALADVGAQGYNATAAERSPPRLPTRRGGSG